MTIGAVKSAAITLALVLSHATGAGAGETIQGLTVEYQPTPIGIDVTRPRFAWRMESNGNERGAAQTAYRIEVRDPKGAVAWDTARVETSNSLAIGYQGLPLKPATRYVWTVTVWNQHGAPLTGTSWFENGPDGSGPGSPAWGGAKWIGGGDDDLVLYAPYLAIFDVRYAVTIRSWQQRARASCTAPTTRG